MKNVYVLPTNKPSRLIFSGNNTDLLLSKEPISFKTFERSPQNIYITSDEEIKKGDWILDAKFNLVNWAKYDHKDLSRDWSKIVLTTDQDLIKDDVRAINDTFLEWFVKNPSCEEVKVDSWSDDLDGYWLRKYKIIIPSEEPQQETLEEAAKNYIYKPQNNDYGDYNSFINGAKWQQQRSYSEEDMREAFEVGFIIGYKDEESTSSLTFEEWFEQFKNK